MSRPRRNPLAEDAGLVVQNSVTKKLDILVVADPDSASGKADKARSYGTRIMAEAAFWSATVVDEGAVSRPRRIQAPANRRPRRIAANPGPGESQAPANPVSRPRRIRVVSETKFMEAMGMCRSGALSKRRELTEAGTQPPLHLAFKNLQPYVVKHLSGEGAKSVKYKAKNGSVGHGI